MPDEEGNVKADEETQPDTPLHASSEGGGATETEHEEDVEGNIGGENQDASDVEKTGGATAGSPADPPDGDDDPSQN